ncbi:hypothetical protein D7Y21_30095 [Corallococcus sp. AB045]|uniref:hypothetical protein n=1 Tax=Corallococcus sp. AB045 TaxID=2316719 RepID=UPI000EC96EC2|nr:hypothetical protein [Corallococcus sp. AB045]RKH81537.1 hypothetical protein D7Y21_30095 [Corallococcus sp. AB045]
MPNSSSPSTPQVPLIPPTTEVISIPVAGPLDVSGDNGEFRLIQTGSSLALVGVDDDKKLQGYFSASTIAYLSRPQGNPKRLDPWTHFTIEKDSTQSSLAFLTQKRIGVVANRDLVYIFWIDTTNNLLCATRVSPGSTRSTTDWCQVSLPSTTAGGSATPVKILAHGVSACAGKGATEILLNYLVWDSTHNQLQVWHLVLDTGDYNPFTNNWVSKIPSWFVTAPVTSPTQTSSNLSHLDVRTILVTQPGATATDAPVNCVIAALWDETHTNTTTFSWTLDAACHANVSASPPAPMLLNWPNSTRSRKALGTSLTVDPAGRLVALFADGNKSNAISIAVIQDILPLRQLNASVAAPVWKEYGKIFTSTEEDTMGPLSMFFSVGAIPEASSQDATTLPIILGMVWVREASSSIGSPIQMSSLKYGDFKMQTALHPPKQENAGKRLLTSVCDPFPMPIPAPEVWGNSSPDGMADWNMFDYEMNTTQEDVVLNEINFSATLGFQTSSRATASVAAFDGLKAGGSFGLSVKAGGSGRFAWQDGKFTAQSIKVQTKAYRHPYYPLSDASPYLVRPYGCYFGRSLFWLRSQYGTAANLAFNQNTSFTPAPLIVAHWPVVSKDADETAAGDFFSYACTPGVVDSYTEAAINARMFNLYTECVNRLAAAGKTPAEIQQIFTAPDGTDLSQFYKGNNYVAAVVAKYGTETNINGQKYLKFAMSGGSVCDGQYRVSNSETSGFGVHLDVNAYAGFVQEVEVGTPGLSASGETYIGGSLDFSFSFQRDSTSTTSSGVGVYTYLNTLAPTQSLSARLYILKEAYLWALELKYFPAIARDWYLQALATAKQQGEFTSPAEEPNLAMLAGTTSADNLLLYEQSLPTRFMFVVTGWDQGPQPYTPINVPRDLPGGYDIATFNVGVPDGSTFKLPGPCDVAYGANGHFRFIPGVTGSITFNAATFGDPQSGGANVGYYRQVGYPNRSAYNVQQDFTRVCGEGQTYALGDTPTTVAFGTDTLWNVVGGLTGTVSASDPTFGDPARGKGKELRILSK